MRYNIDFQYMRKDALRPTDDGTVIGIEANDKSGLVLLPNIGDHVSIGPTKEYASFCGKVRSRLFSYQRLEGEIFCTVNIVVEEVDKDVWAELEKC